MGFTDDTLGELLAAAVSSYTNANPGHANLNLLQDRAPRSRVTDYRVPAKLHGVYIDPDDLLCAWRGKSLNGPVRMEREVIERAWAKATGEKTTGDAVRSGMSAREAFERYRIM